MRFKSFTAIAAGIALFALLFSASLTVAQQPDRQLRQGPAAAGQGRLALVIGNGAYTNAPPLKNPPNDARDMAATLKELGFDVTSGINVNQREMKRLIREFGQKLKSGGSGLFYYAGHGVQSKGRNYLIPVDAEIQSEAEVEDSGVDVALVLNYMDDAQNGLNIVILDACRNNPFARSFRSATDGLAQVDAPTGTLIAYATAPGRVASDGPGHNGLYTSELLKQMRVPGLSVTDMFMHVRAEVMKETANKQVPWEASSLVGSFYFTASRAKASAPDDLSAANGVKALEPEWPKPERDLPAPVRLEWAPSSAGTSRQLSFNVPSGWTRTQREQNKGETYQQIDFRAPDSPQTNISIQVYRTVAPRELKNGSAEIYSDAKDFIESRRKIYANQKVSARLTDTVLLNLPTGEWQTFTADMLDVSTHTGLVGMLDAVYPDDVWQKQNVSFDCSTCYELKPGSISKFNSTRHSYAVQQVGDKAIIVLLYTAPIEKFDDKMLPSVLATLRKLGGTIAVNPTSTDSSVNFWTAADKPEILIDGELKGEAKYDKKYPVSTGSHHVIVRAKDHKSFETDVVVGGWDDLALKPKLERITSNSGPAATQPAPSPENKSSKAETTREPDTPSLSETIQYLKQYFATGSIKNLSQPVAKTWMLPTSDECMIKIESNVEVLGPDYGWEYVFPLAELDPNGFTKNDFNSFYLRTIWDKTGSGPKSISVNDRQTQKLVRKTDGVQFQTDQAAATKIGKAFVHAIKLCKQKEIF